MSDPKDDSNHPNHEGKNGSKDASPNPHTYSDLYYEIEARELFENWCKRFGQRYSSVDEQLYRFSVFMKNLERETRTKARSPSYCYSSHDDEYADKTIDEFMQHFGLSYADSDSSEEEFVRKAAQKVDSDSDDDMG